MRINQPFIYALILAVCLTTVPAFAQVGGLGANVGVGGAVRAGNAGAAAGSTAGANAGTNAGTNAGVNAGTNAGVNAGGKAGAQGQPVGVLAGSNDHLAAQIQSNPELATRVQSMLPAGTSMSAAAAGFKNQGQFLAALHASQNLSIPFDQLKARMTGSASTSLGAAIHASKPAISESQAKAEAKKAEAQAKATASAKATTAASVR